MSNEEALRPYFEQLAALERGGWTTVYSSWHRDSESNGGSYSAFTSPSRREKALSDPGWDLLQTDGRPYFAQGMRDGKYQDWLDRGPFYSDVEPLVIVRDFDGVVPSTLEVSQEFRLLHNLYWDLDSGEYRKVEANGTTQSAIRFGERSVSVRTRLLRQFQAARQVDLLIFFETVEFFLEVPPGVSDFRWEDDTTSAALYVSDSRISDKFFTRFTATRLVAAPPIERSGLPPFDDVDAEAFPRFLIGVDDDGNDISFTCDPDQLANHFGKNPDSPHYLTLVAFRRDVLLKYYENPELYTVDDGHVWCASLWVLRVDNHSNDYIRVFLGDLGRDLPRSEREYWRTFNVQPEGLLSETLYRRAFLGEWAEPTSPDLLFRSEYRQLGVEWRQAMGWALFLSPESGDASLLRRLRVPLNDSQTEFESTVAILVKLLVDSLNERQIGNLLPSKVEGEKGISKFYRLLSAAGYGHSDRDIALLRTLQEIRSRGTAHRKGSKYEALLTQQFGAARGQAAAIQLFDRANTMLRGLRDWITSREPEKGGA